MDAMHHITLMRRERRRPAPRDIVVAPPVESRLFLIALIITVLIHGAVVIRAEDTCESFEFPDSQERHYGKTDFKVHSRVAETVGSLLSVFYDESQDVWSISPEDLREIVSMNIHAVEGTKIYGSAIAFEPNLWRQTRGLSDGVPFPAASEACLMDLSEQFCEPGNNITADNYRIDTLVNNSEGGTLYCPYAYHGSPDEQAFANCSKATPEYCPTMDLARAYDYSEMTNPDVEWFTAPRCLFLLEGVTTGYWTSPYFDAGAGNINMVTFSQPIIKGDKFLGITTIDIEVDKLCYGSQCKNTCPLDDYNYTVSDTCNGNNGRTVSYSTSIPSCPIDPHAVSSLSCSYVPTSSTIGIVALTLGSLGAFVCLVVIVLLISKRNSALIQASQVRISCGFVASAFLANIGTFAYVGGLTDAKCKLRFWALVLPMTMLLAFLFGKVYRAYIVFMAAQKFQRVKITDKELLVKILAVIMVQIAILLVWTFVEDPRLQDVTMSESVDPRYCTGDDCFPTQEQCVDNHGVVGIVSIVYVGILLLIGCVLSLQSRKLPNCFAEAKFIMLAIYNVALVVVMFGIVAAVADLSVSAESILLTFAIFLTTTGSVLLVFVPKFITIWSVPDDEIQRNLRGSLRSQRANGNSRYQTYTASDAEGGQVQQQSRLQNSIAEVRFAERQSSIKSASSRDNDNTIDDDGTTDFVQDVLLPGGVHVVDNIEHEGIIDTSANDDKMSNSAREEVTADDESRNGAVCPPQQSLPPG